MGIFESIHLDRKASKPLYIQIYEEILNLIKEQKLVPEEKLPPIRRLSSLLNVNSVTVVNAYKLLEEQGYVVSKVGSGTYVNPALIFKNNQNESINIAQTQDKRHTVQQKPAGANTEGAICFDFAGAAISPEFFPVKQFQEVLNEVLERDKGYAFDYQDSMGYTPLREAIKDFILKEYKINAPIEEIQIVSGAQQGIDIIAKALLDFQDTVFVESPTYTGAIDVFKSRGAKIVEIPIEKDGIDIEKLTMMLKNKTPKFFYTMPNYQNPTGYSYSLEKKQELLTLAMKYNFLIVEDDHANDLYYKERPALLKGIDDNGRVLYIKSFSRPFMPGIRLAFIVSSKNLAEKIAYAKYSTDIFSSGLFQRAMDLFFRKSLWNQHVAEVRNIFHKRWEIMNNALKKYLPTDVDYICPNGGLFYWLSLPDNFYSMNLYNEAIKKGVLIVPGDLFYPDRRPSSNFRLSFADTDVKDIDKGIYQLAEIINTLFKNYPSNISRYPIL